MLAQIYTPISHVLTVSLLCRRWIDLHHVSSAVDTDTHRAKCVMEVESHCDETTSPRSSKHFGVLFVMKMDLYVVINAILGEPNDSGTKRGLFCWRTKLWYMYMCNTSVYRSSWKVWTQSETIQITLSNQWFWY